MNIVKKTYKSNEIVFRAWSFSWTQVTGSDLTKLGGNWQVGFETRTNVNENTRKNTNTNVKENTRTKINTNLKENTRTKTNTNVKENTRTKTKKNTRTGQDTWRASALV